MIEQNDCKKSQMFGAIDSLLFETVFTKRQVLKIYFSTFFKK